MILLLWILFVSLSGNGNHFKASHLAFTAQKAIQGNRSVEEDPELGGDAEHHSVRWLQHSTQCLSVWWVPDEAGTFHHGGK